MAHVLAFDYRGFGRSTGSPSEHGLITDAISVIEWALKVAKVSPDRIILIAQSLGTGLATAAAHHYINKEPMISFAGLILCAGFTDSPSALMDYSIGGFLPLLGPLRASGKLQAWFRRQIKDTWKTEDRLAELVSKSERLRLTLVHATSDDVIRWEQT